VSLLSQPFKPARVFVLLGVRLVDGVPSEQMKTRVNVAVRLLGHDAASVCIVSGGSAGRGASEASVMRTLLMANGVASERIFLEENALSTLQNVRYSLSLAKTKFGSEAFDVVVCTEGYHSFRSEMLFRAVGASVVKVALPFIASGLPVTKKVWVCLREAIAFVKDYARVRLF